MNTLCKHKSPRRSGQLGYFAKISEKGSIYKGVRGVNTSTKHKSWQQKKYRSRDQNQRKPNRSIRYADSSAKTCLGLGQMPTGYLIIRTEPQIKNTPAEPSATRGFAFCMNQTTSPNLFTKNSLSITLRNHPAFGPLFLFNTDK